MLIDVFGGLVNNDKATNSIILDKKHAKYVPRIFDLYITGAHSLQQIADILHSEQVTTGAREKTRTSMP